MQPGALEERLANYPRVPLVSAPSALEPLERLTGQLRLESKSAPTLWIKRDDGIGPPPGGNKARTLEFLMGEAQARRAGKVVTFGGLQSNHARMTASVSRQLGMEPHLFYFDRRPSMLGGNLLLNWTLDACMHYVPLGGGNGGLTLEATNRLVRLLSWAVVGPSYFIPVGGYSPLGCLGYIAAALEIQKQVDALGLRDVTLVIGAGTGCTLAGLWAGFKLLASPIRVLGIDVGKLWRAFPVSIARVAEEICTRLGEPHECLADDLPLIVERYVGRAYAAPTQECAAAMRRLAECEGIFLDPVYTGKAMAGLLDLVQKERFGPDENVIFLHSGGMPSLFAFPQAVLGTQKSEFP